MPRVSSYNSEINMALEKPSFPPELIAKLKKIVGEKSVLTELSDLYLYSFDSALDRSMPPVVVLPETPDHVSLVMRLLHQNKKPFVARGAATSLCGGPVPLHGAVVIGLSRLTRVGKLDKEKKEVVVEPGVVNLKLQQVVAPDGLFYPPDPGSQKACTIGGNIATNAGGPHCLKYGVTSNYVLGMDWVFPDGQQMHLRVEDPGFDVLGFLVGSEGTLGIATKIRLKLLQKPAAIRTMLVSFPSIEQAIQSVTDIIADGLLPATLEAMDKTTVAAVEAFAHAGYPTDAEAVLLIEVDGTTADELDAQVQRIETLCKKNNRIEFRFAKDEAERAKLWEGRRGAYPAMARLAPNVLVEDGAVPRTKLPEALRQIKQIATDAGLRVALLFHAGDGNLHPQIVFDERDERQTRIVKEAGQRMLKVCVDLGGTISGEHGIGSDKREAMKWLFTRETLTLFRKLKNVFDPENLANPDKLIPLIGKSAPSPATPAAETSNGEMRVQTVADSNPKSEQELVEAVKRFASRKVAFAVQGMRTKYTVSENYVLSMTAINQIVDFDKSNLTLTVQAGADIMKVIAEVEKENRYLWIKSTGTVGGVVATRSSVVPAMRELILGMRVLLPTGEIVTLGAKTMKNVAGYDVPKLLIGSWGTLGIILDVTFRLFPYAKEAKSEETLRPFVFRDIHKKIRRAFDPEGILSPRMVALTEKEITDHPKGVTQNVPQAGVEQTFRSLEEKFWM